MKKSIAVLALALGAYAPLRATNYSNEVLAIGVGARALGMGGAYVGVADDSTAVYWNPAGLPKVKHVEISAIQQGRQYSGLSLNEVGSRYIFTSGAMSFPGVGTFGAAFMRFGVEDIPYVTGVDAFGAPIVAGAFATEDLAFIGSYGKKLHPAINLGLTAKYLSGGTVGLSSGNATYTYMGADLGLLLEFGGWNPSLKGLSLGLNAQDVVSSGVAWKGTATNPTDPVDANFKVGLAYSPQAQFLKANQSELTFAADMDPKYSPNTLYHVGGEFWYKKTLAFRGGTRLFMGGLQQPELTLGASVRMFILQVDYAFINYELTPMHYLSLAVRF